MPQENVQYRGPAIVLRDVACEVDGRRVLSDVNLEIAQGESFAIIGPSGAGKTTLLRVINGLIDPQRGSVEVMGHDVREVSQHDLRRRIGYVIQDGGLFDHWDVRRNVALVPKLMRWPAQRVRQRTDELLQTVGLDPEQFGRRFPAELSGGERQRVGVARALAADPQIVLMDEPFGALDSITRQHMQDEFLLLTRRLRKTFVLITHDVFEAVRLADRIAVLRDGRLLQCADALSIVEQPADSFVEALLGRHRYQLRLTAMRLAHVVAIGAVRHSSAEGLPMLSERTSVFDALEYLNLTRSQAVSVTRDDVPYAVLDRQLILEAIR